MKAIPTGATLGILGSGQLGRMFTQAAHQLGYRVHVFSPEANSPTGQISEFESVGSYDDPKAIESFAKSVAVATFEFENVPSTTSEPLARFVPVRPSGEILHITQHRLREKTMLQAAGFPVTTFHAITKSSDIDSAVKAVGLPAVMKTAGFGYDGKGQKKVNSVDEIRAFFQELKQQPCILEAWVNFDCEASLIIARNEANEFTHWGLIRNDHRNHILDVSMSPAGLPDSLEKEAEQWGRRLANHLDLVGVLCIEFFVTKDGGLLFNELAPRPHNSGHLTIEGFETSQFAQQVRAVCGLPLGPTKRIRPAAMANILGDLWFKSGTLREPNWKAVSMLKDVTLHLYGKKEARPGRKMGHLTALAATPEQAREKVTEARNLL